MATRPALASFQETLYALEMGWADEIRARDAGSFDPLRRFTLTPAEKGRAGALLWRGIRWISMSCCDPPMTSTSRVSRFERSDGFVSAEVP